MKRVLAAVALLGTIPGARAADVPRYPPTPRYLGACGAETGGFRLPDTEGCLRISGFVAAEGGWAIAPASLSLARGATPARVDAGGANLSRSSLGVGARLAADLRLPTDLGPVHAFVSLRGRKGLATDRAAR